MALQHPVDQLAPCALDALTEDERLETLAHLTQCAECRAVASRYRSVAGMLALAVPQPPPAPIWLKRDILRAAASTPRQHGSDGSGRHPKPLLAHTLSTTWAAVFVVLALGAGILGGQALGPLVPGSKGAPADQTVVLAATAGGQGARGFLYAGPAASTLSVTGLPALPADRVYEVWVVGSEGTRPAGTFTTTVDGRGAVVMDRAATARHTVAVTVEPAPGSSEPTGPILLEGVVGKGAS